MADDVADQPLTRCVVEHLAVHRAGLAPVVVLGVQGVGGVHQLPAGVPAGRLRVPGVGLRAALRVRVVHGVGRVLVPHLAGCAVGVHGRDRLVYRQLVVVRADPGAVGVRVGEQPAEQHLVRAGADAGHEVAGLEGGLLDLGVVVGGVAVEGHPADLDQRVVAVWPHLGQVERVEPVGLGLLERHDLHLERPGRVLAPLDRVVQIPGVVVAVRAGELVGLGLGEELDALAGDEVVLHPELLAGRIDPHVGVAGVAVHVPPALRNSAVAHQPGHHVGRLGREGPEVPLHVVVAQVVVHPALLRTDEVLELQRIPDEEDRDVVADHVVVSLGRVELQREPARVAPGVGAAPLAGHRGEPGQHVGPGAGLEHRGFGVGADVVRHLEGAEGAAALGMGLALWRALAVPLRHLFDEVVVLEQNRSVRADGERVVVALDRDAGGRRGRLGLRAGHTCVSLVGPAWSPAGCDGLARITCRRG